MMFEQSKTVPAGILKQVSILESFYNPLDAALQRGFRELWTTHFQLSRQTRSARFKNPYIEDLALIMYFLQVGSEEAERIVPHYLDSFRHPDGTPYPTYRDYLPNYIKK